MFSNNKNHCPECDTRIGFLQEGISELKDAVKEHKDKEEVWQEKIEKQQTEILSRTLVCPETAHIKVEKVAAKVTVWCYIFAALIASLTIGTFVSGLFKEKVKPKDVREEVMELREDLRRNHTIKN